MEYPDGGFHRAADGVMWSGPTGGSRVSYSAYCCSARWSSMLPGLHSVVALELLIIDERPVLESLRQGIAALLPRMLTL